MNHHPFLLPIIILLGCNDSFVATFLEINCLYCCNCLYLSLYCTFFSSCLSCCCYLGLDLIEIEIQESQNLMSYHHIFTCFITVVFYELFAPINSVIHCLFTKNTNSINQGYSLIYYVLLIHFHIDKSLFLILFIHLFNTIPLDHAFGHLQNFLDISYFL